MANWLISKGIDVNIKRENGDAALHMSVFHAQKIDVDLLLANGADVNAIGKDGETALYRASNTTKIGIENIIVKLLLKGANINTGKEFKRTFDWALPAHMSATINGETSVLKILEEFLLKSAKNNPRNAITQITAHLSLLLQEKISDRGIRTVIIKLSNNLKQALAAQSFNEALKVAPWWSDAYYNLGIAQELAEQYDEAEKAFNFYLLGNVSAKEKRVVQDRIYELAAKRKLSGVR